jgi:hypothetical protein
MASRIAKAIETNRNEEADDPLVRARLKKQSKFDKNLIIHYTYEKRLRSNKTVIHQLWNQIFQQTPVIQSRLIIGTRNILNLTRELVHRRPQQKTFNNEQNSTKLQSPELFKTKINTKN